MISDAWNPYGRGSQDCSVRWLSCSNAEIRTSYLLACRLKHHVDTEAARRILRRNSFAMIREKYIGRDVNSTTFHESPYNNIHNWPRCYHRMTGRL